MRPQDETSIGPDPRTQPQTIPDGPWYRNPHTDMNHLHREDQLDRKWTWCQREIIPTWVGPLTLFHIATRSFAQQRKCNNCLNEYNSEEDLS